MLKLKPNCECCDIDLPPDSVDVMVCSFECTFCARCVDERLHGICPNCGGNFQPRPTRSKKWLEKHPPSGVRVLNKDGCSSAKKIVTRMAAPDDCTALLKLMKGLAEFEGYLDDFKVDEEALLKRGFPVQGTPEFHARVAEKEGELIGMLVYYFISFTFDLRPTLFIKEFFVDDSVRGEGIGERLFAAVRNIAVEQNCGRIKWDVLADNSAAQRFYERQGARRDSQWRGYILEV